jgi:hypothetical protein
VYYESLILLFSFVHIRIEGVWLLLVGFVLFFLLNTLL